MPKKKKKNNKEEKKKEKQKRKRKETVCVCTALCVSSEKLYCYYLPLINEDTRANVCIKS